MGKKGTCIICGRNDVAIVGHEHCSACYPIGKRFNWNNAKTIAYRKKHPVGEGRGRQPGSKSGKTKRKYTKRHSESGSLYSADTMDIPEKKSIKGGFIETLVKAFEMVDKLSNELEIRNQKIDALEKERLEIKGELLKSRFTVNKLTRESVDKVEKLIDAEN